MASPAVLKAVFVASSSACDTLQKSVQSLEEGHLVFHTYQKYGHHESHRELSLTRFYFCLQAQTLEGESAFCSMDGSEKSLPFGNMPE